jgi:hypothetical protein
MTEGEKRKEERRAVGDEGLMRIKRVCMEQRIRSMPCAFNSQGKESDILIPSRVHEANSPLNSRGKQE